MTSYLDFTCGECKNMTRFGVTIVCSLSNQEVLRSKTACINFFAVWRNWE